MRSRDPVYITHTLSCDPAYNTHTRSKKCIRRMSNFGGLSVTVKEIMQNFFFISLLYCYIYVKKNILKGIFVNFFFTPRIIHIRGVMIPRIIRIRRVVIPRIIRIRRVKNAYAESECQTLEDSQCLLKK